MQDVVSSNLSLFSEEDETKGKRGKFTVKVFFLFIIIVKTFVSLNILKWTSLVLTLEEKVTMKIVITGKLNMVAFLEKYIL